MKIKITTKEKLEQFGSMNDDYDTVICKLLDHVNQCDKYWNDVK